MDSSDLRFLVVEDHPYQRWLIANQLREMGSKWVFTAVDGNSALELMSMPGPPIDIVISDLDTPNIDGMALIRNIAEHDQPTSLIVVGGADRALLGAVESMAQAYGVKVLGSIQKPFTSKKLRPLIAARDAAGDARVQFSADDVAEGMRAHQFETYFQPKVEIKSGEIRGAEALSRWLHPDKGLVLPVSFIGAVESSGLMDELTSHVVRDATAHCSEWRGAGHDITVSVNLSPTSLADTALADHLLDLAHEARFEPRHLTLEVTESAATQDIGKELEVLARLRMMGFGLSIDDYGTGYSSMKRLARIPFSELKIDRGFVKRARSQLSSRAMVESSLELAHKLGIDAVAEGVETREEWELLLQLGCELAQGYFIAPPMSAPDFLDWMKVKHVPA